MSIITERFPQCDLCQETFPDYQRQPPLSPRALRVEMRRNGWLGLGRHDTCPDCVQKNRTRIAAAKETQA